MFPQRHPCSFIQNAPQRFGSVLIFHLLLSWSLSSFAFSVTESSPWLFWKWGRSSSSQNNIDPHHPLIGNWKFVRMILDGQETAAPNPKLHLYFEFRADNVVRVFYNRTDERGFCERLGRYTFEDPILYQEIYWVNPKNNDSCSQDTDMQLGVSYTTFLRFRNKDLLMKISMPEGELYFVFEKQLSSGMTDTQAAKTAASAKEELSK